MEVTEEESMNLKIDEEKLSSLKKKLSSLFWRTERGEKRLKNLMNKSVRDCGSNIL